MATPRYRTASRPRPLRELPCAALRECFREGYGLASLKRDLMAGAVVGVVALPLSMALAIAVGVPPQHGLYTAIAAGFVVALLGGSRTQVSGPTAAFVVILAPIVGHHGLAGLMVSGLLAGMILVLLGLLRLGKLIQFIPHPVTTGFTAGIAIVIAGLQLENLLGLELLQPSPHFFERMGEVLDARGTLQPHEALLGLATLAGLVVFPRLSHRVPAPLVVLPAAAVCGWVLGRIDPALAVDTIATRFTTTVGEATVHGIPRLPPLPSLPWHADGGMKLSPENLYELLPGAFAIAMLGAIESLLSAVVADGLVHTRHDPDAELLAQGAGNLIAPFLGGIPATGAIARTATSIRSGAHSPIAAMTHAVVVLVVIVIAAPLVGFLPMTSLAALLLLVAWNMSEVKHFAHTLRVAPRSDVTVMLVCFGLTVAFDMVVAVTVGIVLAALLFMRRMAEVSEAVLVGSGHPDLPPDLPPGTIVYDIGGPLFFGAAQKAMAALAHISDDTKVVIMQLDDVPAMDATGLVALESALTQLTRRNVHVVLTGLQPQPRDLLTRASLATRYPGVEIEPGA